MDKIELVAKLAHEINKAYCESQGDHSQVPWEEAPSWQRASCMNGVKGYFEGTIKSPEDSHAAWCKEKIEEGWEYGITKNPLLMTHPCLVPYEQLSKDLQAKDYIFQAVCTFFMEDNMVIIDMKESLVP